MLGSTAAASPNIDLDDPIYQDLATRRALGQLGPYLGGFAPLTDARVRELLHEPALPDVWWVSPLRRGIVRGNLVHEAVRDYSTPARPRDLAGSIALSCEHHAGQPCGDGAALAGELESAAGYGHFVSAAVRLRALVGTSDYDSGVELDRAYVSGDWGPVAVEVGRDVMAFGPSARTQLGWGDHAAPVDHARVSTARPFVLGPVQASAQYVVGRLRDPQVYAGNVVTIARAQLDWADLEVGVMQLLQLGGRGAPGFELGDFVLEHFRRRDASAGAMDSSNRRFGGDVSWRIAGLWGARLYYAVMFEDIRRRYLGDAIRHDADHVLGVDVEGLVFEWHHTGARSQEHVPRVTGFTNDGFVVGAPLGPDASSWFAAARIERAWGDVVPWVELAQLSSATYAFVVDGPIERTSEGVTESRYRVGARLRVPVGGRMWRVDADGFVEHVDAFAFESGATRNNVGLVVALVWQPGGRLGRLANE